MLRRGQRIISDEELRTLAKEMERQLDDPLRSWPSYLDALVEDYTDRKGKPDYETESLNRLGTLIGVLEEVYPRALRQACRVAAFNQSEGVQALLGLLLIRWRHITPVPMVKEDIPSWADVARFLGSLETAELREQLTAGLSEQVVHRLLVDRKGLLKRAGGISSTAQRCKEKGFVCLAQAVIDSVVGGELAPRPFADVSPDWLRLYVDRPRLVSDLESKVRNAGGGDVPVMVLGGAGAGKTTLLVAYGTQAKDENRYSDGVFFFTLGENPHWVRDCRYLAEQLRSPMPPHVRDLAGIRPWLQGVLKNKRVLLLLDDAYSAGDIQPFLAGGSGCRVIVSSRDAGIADGLASRDYWLGVGDMELDEAEALCRKHLGSWHPWDEADRDNLRELGRLIGYSPLALGALISLLPEMGWKHLLLSVKEKLHESPEGDAAEWEAHLDASLKASFDALGGRRDWLMRLAVLPQVSSFGVDAAALLYGVGEGRAAERLVFLAKRHLLEGVTEPGFEGPRYRMHGFVLKCIREEKQVKVTNHTFAWTVRYKGVLFDREGWWRSVFLSPALREIRPLEKRWLLGPKSLDPNLIRRIFRPFWWYVDRIWKTGNVYVPFEVWATAYRLGQRSRWLRTPFYVCLGISVLLARWLILWIGIGVAVVWRWITGDETQAVMFWHFAVAGIAYALLILAILSPYLISSFDWQKFIYRYVQGFMEE